MTLKDLAPWNKKEYSATGTDPDEDCLSCRLTGSYPQFSAIRKKLTITGAVALGGLGTYTYVSGMRQLRAQRKAIELSKSKYKYSSRQAGIVSISATLMGLAWYRMLN
jgi:hypothetical protein